MTRAATVASPRKVDHYENFPVASWLCPPELRPPIAAIYWFARTADDIADEGDALPDQRLAELDRYTDALRLAVGGQPGMPWPEVFLPLSEAIRQYLLSPPLLHDLLDAFKQDVRKTRLREGYATRAEVLDYCRRSANPIGRLLLHLHRVRDHALLAQSDAICSALQLINFWQDLSVDLPRGRYYVPAEDARRHGLSADRPLDWPRHANAPALVRDLVAWARELMLSGAPLVHQVPGRAGWELRLVVQGGLRILDRIEAAGFNSFLVRPRLRWWDTPLLLWRAARM